MRLKIIFILIFLLYQTNIYSKTNENNEFNQRYLSNYFSALLSSVNKKDKEAIKFYEASKFLVNKHDNFLKNYIFSLVLDGQVKKAIKQIKASKNKSSLNFFEAELLLILDSLKKRKYESVNNILKKNKTLIEFDGYEFVIYEILSSYNELFLNKKISKPKENFGKLNLITDAFQNCYLESNKAESYFLNIINSENSDYSRYLFFYLANIIENEDYITAKKISKTVESHSSSLLISQAKNWIDENKFKKFNNYFSCKNENNLLGEFFFLISNLYSSQGEFDKSNFYLNISIYLNPKFYFNLSLLVENYYSENNFDSAEKILEKFSFHDEIFNWYKIKKTAQIFKKTKSDEDSLKYIEKKIKTIENPSTKMLYDLANIYKNFKKYKKAIEYYNIVLSNLDSNSSTYAEALYRRGGSYERIGEHEKSDNDLLKSLKINPEDPYTLNYLAYSWLERKFKINTALKMLQNAYNQKKNDPYIIDSIGWAYFLIEDYEKAEKYLIQAVKLMPDDPIVNDHYGDILWMLNKKIQARYFWKNVLKLKDTEDFMKKNVKEKLLKGLNKI